MHVTCRFVYLFIFTFLTFKCSIEVNGDGNDSGEDTNETSSEEVYQFEAEDDIEGQCVLSLERKPQSVGKHFAFCTCLQK